MTGRAAFAVLLATAGCGAQLGSGDDTNNGTPDAKVWRDAAIDAPPDARPCMGGAMAAVAPDGSCLVLVTTPATWLNAKAGCTAMNAHLAYLKTAAVDTFAISFVGARTVFIGGSDRTTEGAFVWDDNTAFAYTNWGANEPNNGDNGVTYVENCVVIAGLKVEQKWDDRPCDATQVPTSGVFDYLCQY